MKQYIRFENGRQVEVTTLDIKPTGEGWKAAPKNFDFSKVYRLNQSGAIEEIPEEELQKSHFNLQKAMVLEELSRIIDRKRSKFVGASESKRKCYELQERAAKAIIDDQDSNLGNLIKPLADVRNIGVLEMAEIILTKANQSNQKIIEAEAIEDEYQGLIKASETPEKLDKLLREVVTKLADGPLPEEGPLPEDF